MSRLILFFHVVTVLTNNLSVEKNRGICISLTQKYLGEVDGIRGVFTTQSIMLELFRENI